MYFQKIRKKKKSCQVDPSRKRIGSRKECSHVENGGNDRDRVLSVAQRNVRVFIKNFTRHKISFQNIRVLIHKTITQLSNSQARRRSQDVGSWKSFENVRETEYEFREKQGRDERVVSQCEAILDEKEIHQDFGKARRRGAQGSKE